MNNFSVSVPINSTSLGQVSVAILREFYKRCISPNIFVIGNQVDLSAQKPDKDFELWLSSCINKANKYHKKTYSCFRLWHTQSSHESVSYKTLLYTFYELSSPTEEEVNIWQNQDVLFASSKWTEKVFRDYDVNKNIVPCYLGFDSHNFKKIENKEYLGKEVINFNLSGKLELRKNTLRIIKMWGRRFGSDARYRLNCLVFNPFLNSTDQESMIASALEGKRYFNIKFHPFLPQNSLVADFLNSGNIDLSGLSSAEGWNYGAFNSIALGKQAVVLKAHAHPTYANENNCFFVNPTSMRPVYDGIFFNEHQQFNQGQVHDFNDDEAIAAMELAIKKAHEPNIEGEKLRSEFTFEKTANTILNEIERLK